MGQSTTNTKQNLTTSVNIKVWVLQMAETNEEDSNTMNRLMDHIKIKMKIRDLVAAISKVKEERKRSRYRPAWLMESLLKTTSK